MSPRRSAAANAAFLLLGALGLAACSDTTPTAAKPQPAPPRLSTGTATDGGQPVSFVTGQIVVRFAPGADGAAIAADHGAPVLENLALDRAAVLKVAPGSEQAAAAELAAVPGVEFAEPDYTYAVVPCEVGNCDRNNDTFMGYRWDLHNNGAVRDAVGTFLAATGASDADIDFQELYDALGPNPTGTATIGILDTGILPTHNDVAGRVVAARGFATGYPATHIVDDNGHGSHVTGIAAGRGNNALGISGVAYGANIRLLNAKVCALYLFPDNSIRTSCPVSSTADGIVWAVDNGANVLNMSFGGLPNATSGSALQRAALQYAIARNVLPVCAAGNDNFPGIAFPARFPECFAVGATDWNDTRASYSNFSGDLDISAPGGDGENQPYSLILSLSNAGNGNYAFNAGTSMATPQVVGLAAVLYASGMTDQAAVRTRIQSTADDLGPVGFDVQFGAGRINAYRAVTLKDPFAPPVAVTGGPYTGFEGSPVSFDASGSFDPNNHPLSSYSWNFLSGPPVSGPTATHTYADNGVYSVFLQVIDESNRSTIGITKSTIANVPPTITSLALASASVLSGVTVDLTASFSDPGIVDNPWQYRIDWPGAGAATIGATNSQSSPITASRRFCAEGDYPVTLTVTDKDGGSDAESTPLAVRRFGVGTALMGAGLFPHPPRSGRLSVKIVGTPTFNVASIDPATVTLGNPGSPGVPVARKLDGSLWASVYDVNYDGLPDLVVQFDRAALSAARMVYESGSAQVEVLGVLRDACGQFRGTTTVTPI